MLDKYLYRVTNTIRPRGMDIILIDTSYPRSLFMYIFDETETDMELIFKIIIEVIASAATLDLSGIKYNETFMKQSLVSAFITYGGLATNDAVNMYSFISPNVYSTYIYIFELLVPYSHCDITVGGWFINESETMKEVLNFAIVF